MKKSELYANLEVILELEPGTIRGDEELESFADWNSLALISFIAFVDGTLNISLSPQELQRAKTVGDLTNAVRAKIED